MNVTHQIRKKLREYGFSSNLDQEIEKMGVQLTICQLVVVVLSIMSVVFLFLPIMVMQNVTFMIILFALSMLCLVFGIWFWVKQEDICEHPDEVPEL